MKFGEFLIENHYAGPGIIEEALKIQKRHKKKLGRLLVDLDYLDRETLNTALTDYLKPHLTLRTDQLKSQMELLKPSPALEKLARHFNAMVFKESLLEVELIRPESLDDQLLEKMEKVTGKKIICHIVPQAVFDFLNSSQEGEKLSDSKIVVSHALTDDEKLDGGSPYAKLFKECLGKAKKKGVSDIHIEPCSTGVNIRFRLHGSLYSEKLLAKEHREAFISTVKDIINMDLAIVGKSQDSRASFKDFKLDVRGCSISTLYGEKLVLRLLDKESDFDLSQSGLSQDALKVLREAVNKRDGLILISGPTGSGKTTTLYSLLLEIDREKKNISTLENPVEYEFEGMNQVGIVEGGLTFHDSLRALMRQDPDVILVGEIRDKETADLCFKAASTGHLVLSTIHANGAREVIERLTNLGVDSFSIKNNLRLSVAQRLLPLICPHCSEEAPRKILSRLKGLHLSKSDNFRMKSWQGCQNCHKGIIGRTAIVEYMEKESIENFLTGSQKSFSPMLRDSVLELARQGKIALSEVLEVM